MDELLKLRNDIDAIDAQIVELFEKRMAVSESVAAIRNLTPRGLRLCLTSL